VGLETILNFWDRKFEFMVERSEKLTELMRAATEAHARCLPQSASWQVLICSVILHVAASALLRLATMIGVVFR
jgi:hypothetical protein